MWPERVLLLRSGRHLQTAITALQSRWPGCQIAVVGTDGSQAAIEQAGIDARDTFIYTRRPRFSPMAFSVSTTAMAVRLWRFDRVAILWNDPDGTGQGNVDRTAFLLAPRGFVAITPDGTIVERSVTPQIRREVRRTLCSLAMAVMLGALYLPAMIIPSRRS
jgi:hypothetical protein